LKGVAVPFIIVALLEFIVGYTIVTKFKDIIRVQTYITDKPQKIQILEIQNGKVLSNFVIYRYVEIALIILGIVLMYSSMNDTFWRGIGFIYPSKYCLSLDFAERRGHQYIVYLQELVEKL
jgi:hypothetical protein